MPNTPPPPPAKRTGCFGKIGALVGAIFSGAYLLNAFAGLVEILPDNLPGVGNLDEVFFTGLLIFCLGKLGVNTSWLTRNRPQPTPPTIDEKK